MTQPKKSPLSDGTTAEPADPAKQRSAIKDLDAGKGVSDAEATLVKGGVKKTMQTQ